MDGGLWLYPEGERPEIETRGEVLMRVDRMNGMPRGGDILIPPHGQQVLQGIHVLEQPTLINSFRPHLHKRGKEMSMDRSGRSAASHKRNSVADGVAGSAVSTTSAR